jgi:spoIIIJ-associated protein
MVRLGDSPRRAVDRFPAASGPVAEAAEAAMHELLALAALDLELAVLQGEDRLEIDLWGADEERVVAQFGRLLHALEHLLPRLVRGQTGESVACRVDCGNFHEIREEQLRDLAQRAASEVARHGRPRTLAPMRPDERRIVHLTLADDPAVTTESLGEGYFKRVRVQPERSR